jgi:hypothetical protein
MLATNPISEVIDNMKREATGIFACPRNSANARAIL